MARAKAKVLSSKMIFQGKVFGVRQDRVIEPGGVNAIRDVVTHNGSVVLLPVLRSDILLVRQYRHTVGDYLWELPAGRMERGEKPLAAAQRELEEETGYRARRLTLMMDVFPTPGFVEERMVVYAATGLVPGESHPDEDERISTKPFTLASLLRMIRTHKIHDAKSVAGILYYARFMHSSRRTRLPTR